ncbi:MAG: Tat pathway signal protein [Rikenellaceae bacterium]
MKKTIFLFALFSFLVMSANAQAINTKIEKKDQMIWGCLLHLSFNMWEEYISPHRPFRGYRPELELSEPLWRDAIDKMAKEGVNMVVIDLGDGVKYNSYGEIAVQNAWSVDKLRKELAYIREVGIEPIPKLNFSAAHDTWMGKYQRMVGSKEYYKFCEDIITEVCNIFDNPRYFHLGMDEETAQHQSTYQYVVVRKGDAWWNDFNFLVAQVEKHGARAWIWSDYMLWSAPEQFFAKMSKNVVQSNWYYDNFTDANNPYVQAYLNLNSHGYSQIPTGSYHASNDYSIGATVDFLAPRLDKNLTLGFLQTFWKPTIEENRDRILRGIELIGEAKRKYEKK